PGRRLLRHDRRRSLGEPERGSQMGLHCALPAADLCRRGGSTAGAMKVLIPGPLRSYTRGRHEVEAAGSTLAEVLSNLDRAYPGIRFRMIDEQDHVRRHMRIFVNREQVRALETALQAADEVLIVQALSGG